jgi:hypothetical protein
MRHRLGGPSVLTLVVLLLALLPSGAFADPDRAPRLPLGEPSDLHTTVVPGKKAIRVSWSPPTKPLPVGLAYEVLVDGRVVATTLLVTSYVYDDASLKVGRTYDIGVRTTLGLTQSDTVETTQQLYVAPVTTAQAANPSNPLAGREWGVYLGLQDPAMIGWTKLGSADRDRLAPIAMAHKAKYFGRWISDGQAEQKTREYIAATQAGDPEKLTIMTIFRMYPWEGEASVLKKLPTPADIRSYKAFVNGMARGIAGNRVAIVVQPDGFFAWKAYETWKSKVGRKKALLPARLLAWTAKTFSQQPRTTVYMDMGSEDWARGKVAPVAKFLKLSGVKYARGFSLNVSHKNYLDREIKFAKQVSQALAKMGIPGKHAVLDTVDNGQAFHGSEINPPGQPPSQYTQPGEILPCRTKTEKKPCTALGIPPTTDVDNPAWGLAPSVARTAAEYVDAYLWVSRPWLPDQGEGGTKFSPQYATLLLKTWEFSPYFNGRP